ncbi:type II secretion system F family protein [Streptomyces sp. NPDC058953]|uniref:type II secretion system F family protein n=1 Tax=unclassified Streptomyces TaxID=2593676 RepID=UPI0036B97B97
MTTPVLLTLAAVLLAGVCGVLGVHHWSVGRARTRELVARMSQTGASAETGGRRRRFTAVDRRVRRTRYGRRLDRRIRTTGLDITPGEYVAATAAVLVTVYLVVAAVFTPFFGVLAAFAALWGTESFLTWQQAKRTEAFINQLPELARVLANATQAGLALRTAIAMAADELDDPAGAELGIVADRLAVGQSLDDALTELGERLPSRELVVLVTTLVLANRAGGQVVSSLRNLTQTLEERKETRREVTTMLSQIKVTAFAVPLLGFGFLLMINAMTPGALDEMTGSFVGQTATLIAVGLYIAGGLMIRRMSRIQV